MSSVILTYSKLITTTVANQAVNLADSGTLGHRVQCPMSVDDLNRFFIWHRPAGVQAPVGHFAAHEDTPGSSFSYILANTLSKYYTDIDGVSNGLNFGSAILDANLDPSIRQDGQISANDLIMAYVIYKLYGSSASPTQNIIYNLQDAYGMLTNSTLISSIETSLRTEEASPNAGAVNEMFQDLLSQDPTRFFDAAGKQIPGLFEVNTPTTSTGPWNFVENDRIELNVQFTFSNAVTLASSPTAASVATTISAGTTFKIRLQLLATNTPTAASALITAAAEAKAQELLRQAEEQQEAAEAAEVAAAAADQAETTAAKQAAALQATYTAAITRNAEQQKAVLSAQAAVTAAQAALAAATISGNQANIQQQNAASVVAQALLNNQQAIATQAAADLQNAANAVAKATATVNATQTAAAQAAAQAAAANAKKAKGALDLELASAESLQSTIAGATAASDPFTQSLEQEKEAILDPQNLVTIMAKANAATKTRQAAFNTMLQTFARQTEQLNTYTTLTDTMNSAIAMGSNVSQLQRVNSMVIGASNLVNKATITSGSAASTLAASYSAEINAIQRATMASSNAASLASVVAIANTNSANKSLTTVTTAYVYASTVNASAAAAAADAQTILNNRVANGAPMSEVQTRMKALLDANAVYAATTSTLYGNQAKITLATQAYQAASTIAVNAKANISSVAASNLFALSAYKTSVSTSSAYQANVMYNAKLNQLAAEVNTGLVKLTQANSAVAIAKANLSLAQLKINNALARGQTVLELTVLNDIYAKANDSLTQALLIQTTAQAAYDKKTETATNSQVQLLQQNATAYFNAAITQQQIATDSINSYSTLVSYATQDPAAFPPIDGIPSADVYSTQLGVWQTYLGNFQTLSGTLLTQFNKDLTSASALMAANPAISTSIGSLSNYYTASSNSSHLAFQVNMLSTFFTSFSTVGYDASADLANYSSQYSSAIADTAAAYSSNLAASLASQTIKGVNSAGQTILLAAQKKQLAQISTATVNSKINEYNASVSTLSMIQLHYDQASVAATTAGQALSNAALTTSQGQFILYQRRYADSVAALSALANELNGVSKTVSTLATSLGVGSGSGSFTPKSIPGLTAWYDATDPLGSGTAPSDGTPISTWYDKSDMAYNMLANGSPTFNTALQNSLPGVRLTGNTGYYANCFFHANIPPGTFASELDAFVVYKSSNSNAYNLLITRTMENQLGIFTMYNSNILLVDENYQLTSTYDVYNSNTSLFNINISLSNSMPSPFTLYTNGNPVTLSAPVTLNNIADIGTRLSLGARGDTFGTFNGDYYEVLVFNTRLTSTERQTVEGYLAWKWGLQADLPAAHPHLSTAPIMDGPSLIHPSVLNTYSNAATLRKSELAVAQTNALIQQANSAYINYSQLNDQLQAANQSTSSILDEISVAMAKGANLATIQPLQTKLANIQENTVTLQLDSANLYNTFLTLSTLVSPDASFISSVNSASNATFSATMGARLNESAQQLQKAQVEDSAAATAAAEASAILTTISTQFSIQKQQGLSSAQMAPLTSTLTAASLDFANKNILLNFANSALAQAQANYSSLQSYPSIYTSFTNVSTNMANSFSSLNAGQAAQITSLTQAKNNALTTHLTNAYMGALNYSTLVQADYTYYNNLLVKYNTQMAAGGAPASTYSELTTAYNKYVDNRQKEILFSAAYLSTMTLATMDPSSIAILTTVASNQTKVIEGAKANELYKNLETANTHLFTLNNEFVSIQSAYAVANSDLQIATANNSPQAVLNGKYSTLIGIADLLNGVQIKYNLAQAAVQVAQNNVAMNPNAQGILDTATAKYLEQANLSQANLLVAQYNEAVANEKKTYAALQTANAALKSAQATFTSVIASGADLATIKAARDAQNTAATAVTQAGLLENNAMNALNQALQNANLDQIAQSLIITARLTNENTTAGGAVNAAQAELNVLSTVVAAAERTLTNATAASVAARSTVQGSITTKTAQEIVDLQAAADATAEAASAAQLAFAAAMSNFMAEATTVSSLTQTFSTTTAALTLNTNRNTLLYNGFDYNQTFDRYVLKRSYLPAQVIDGSPFSLYSVTVNPIDMGVYNPSTSYVLGNLVYYPNSDGAQYMAGIAADPRG